MRGYYDQLSGELYFRPKPIEPEAGRTACETLLDGEDQKDALFSANADAGVHACARTPLAGLRQPAIAGRACCRPDAPLPQRAFRSTNRALSDAYLAHFPAGHFTDDVKQCLASLNPQPSARAAFAGNRPDAASRWPAIRRRGREDRQDSRPPDSLPQDPEDDRWPRRELLCERQ